MSLGKPALVAFAGLGLTVLGPLGATVRVLPPLAGFGLFVAGAFIALGGAIAQTRRLVRGPRTGNPVELYALTAFAPFLLILALLSKASAFPRINDVSTNLTDVPQFKDQPSEYPEELKASVRQHYPNLTSLLVTGTPHEAMDRVKKLLEQRPYIKITRDDRVANEMEAECESGIFRFKDDVVLRFRGIRKGTDIEMRSRSRVGKGDAGANAARIRDFFTAFEAEKWN